MESFESWCTSARKKLKENVNARVNERTKVLLDGVEKKCQSLGYNIILTIDKSIQNQINQNILNSLNDINVNPNYRNRRLASQSHCWKIMRSQWNRRKATQLANYLFNPMLFEMLFYLIMTDKHMMKAETNVSKRFSLFVSIFIDALKQQIKFPKAKSMPIIPIQCFMPTSTNKLKVHCESFVEHFGNGIKWRVPVGTYDRSSGTYTYRRFRYTPSTIRCGIDTLIKALESIDRSYELQNEDFIKKKVEEWFRCHNFHGRDKILKNKTIDLVNGYIKLIQQNVLLNNSIIPFELNGIVFKYLYYNGFGGQNGLCCAQTLPNCLPIIPSVVEEEEMKSNPEGSTDIAMHDLPPEVAVNGNLLQQISTQYHYVPIYDNFHGYQYQEYKCNNSNVDGYCQEYNSNNCLGWDTMRGSTFRQFQSTNNFSDPSNRVHRNILTQSRDRRRSVELHVKQINSL